MAVSSKPKAKQTPTRREREAASAAAAAEFDAIDWAPIGRGTLVVLIVLLLLAAAWMFVPGGEKFGGPLQDSNVAAGSTMSTVRRAKGIVTVGTFVPWNTSGGPALLEQVLPIGADGVEIVKTGLAAPGQIAIDPQRGYPPDGLILFPVEGSRVEPGSGTLDGPQIAVGLSGEGSVLGFILVYRVGNEQHRALLPNGAMLCRRACGDTTALEERQRDLFAELSMYVDAPSR